MGVVVTNKKKELKNSWNRVSINPTMEIMDSFLIEMFVMYSYDNLEEPHCFYLLAPSGLQVLFPAPAFVVFLATQFQTLPKLQK